MKRIFTIFTTFIFTAIILAQSPEMMSYQAVVRDATGNLMTNKTIGIQISILQSSVNGAAVYVERQYPTANINGLISLVIGSGKAVSGDFSSIAWEKGPYFIKTEIDLKGEENYTITGTNQILSVPYALHAKTAESVTGTINETDPVFSSSAASGITGINIIYWNSKLDSEVDGSVTNEIQNLSQVLTQGTDAGNKNITNLADPVNAQDASTKAYVDALLIQAGAYTVKDIDGNIYKTVKIGDQIWMAENLRVTHYPNGDPISLVTDNDLWKNQQNGYGIYCYYNNDVNSEYGILYDFDAVTACLWTKDHKDNQGVCPDGWHLPSRDEWSTLTDYLGGRSVAGGKLKESGTAHWNSPNTGATNESNFTAFPGGYRKGDGTFDNSGDFGYWWSRTISSATGAEILLLEYNSAEADITGYYKGDGISVRCLKD